MTNADVDEPPGLTRVENRGKTYTEDVADLLDHHAVQSHMYADDTQLHDSCRRDDIDTLC